MALHSCKRPGTAADICMAARRPLGQLSRDPVSQKREQLRKMPNINCWLPYSGAHMHTHNVKHIKKYKHMHATIVNKNKRLNCAFMLQAQNHQKLKPKSKPRNPVAYHKLPRSESWFL